MAMSNSNWIPSLGTQKNTPSCTTLSIDSLVTTCYNMLQPRLWQLNPEVVMFFQHFWCFKSRCLPLRTFNASVVRCSKAWGILGFSRSAQRENECTECHAGYYAEHGGCKVGVPPARADDQSVIIGIYMDFITVYLVGGDWNHGIFLVNLWLIYGE